MSEFVTVRTADFSAVASREGVVIEAKLKGNADYDAIGVLESLLQAIQVEAARQPVGEVVIDMRELEFMNSSCLKNVASWINDVQELESALRYQVTFRSSTKMRWQRRSLHALRCFAIDLITIEEYS